MPQVKKPEFRALDDVEMRGLLARNNVGRIAYSFRDHVDIEPIHFVYADGWIYCRTSPGAKLATLTHSPWVAFEVDEVSGVFDWQSVVVRGTVLQLSPNGAERERRRYLDAVERLRGVVPEAFTDADPATFRDVILGIHVGEMTGRAASTSGR